MTCDLNEPSNGWQTHVNVNEWVFGLGYSVTRCLDHLILLCVLCLWLKIHGVCSSISISAVTSFSMYSCLRVYAGVLLTNNMR